MQAVDGVSFDVIEGETLGIVGESGCGKSTTARLVTRLLEPDERLDQVSRARTSRTSTARELKPLRREMQMIFQDPYSSLNPRKTVGSIIGEPFVIHGIEKDEGKRKKLVQELMDTVGLNPEHYNRFPHEFSGGQRQRIGVARAIALEAEADRRRRAGLRARRLDPGADPQPAARPAARARADDHLHRPRPSRRAPHVRPRRGDVPRQDRRARRRRRPLRPPAPPVHGRAAVRAVPVPDPRLRAARTARCSAATSPRRPTRPPACRFHTRCPKFARGVCDVDEPLLEPKEGGNLAACHFPLTDEEIATRRVPTAAA